MPESSSRPNLTVLGGPLAGKQLVIDEEVDNILIGSDSTCRFHLPLPGVSPIHARVWVDLEGITVYDANSPRGLYINDDRITGQAPIHNGDILWLGAPGDADVVMIQCRVPPRKPAEATTAQEPTVAIPAPSFEPEATGAAPAPLPEEPAPEATSASQAEPGDFEVVPEAAPAPPAFAGLDEEETQFLGRSQEPGAFEPSFDTPTEEPAPTAAPAPPAFVPEFAESPPAPIPAFFEDDTVADVGAPTLPAMPAPALPPVPLVVEDEPPVTVAMPPAPAPEPTVAMPPPAPPTPPPAPKVAARPATPAPSPRPRPPAAAAPRPTARPAAAAAAPRPAKSSSSMPLIAGLGGLGLVVLAGGGYLAMRYFSPAAPPTTLAVATQPPMPATLPPESLAPVETAPPETAPTPEPVVEATPAPLPSPSPKVADTLKPTPPPPTTLPAAKATPTPAKAAPPPTQPQGPSPEQLRAQQLATLVGQADAALASGSYDQAAGLYDQALKLDPGNSQASRGKQTALARAAAARRTFVAGRTSVQGAKSAKKVSGFESEDVSVAVADYSGRIEFESPKSVRPGESYAVKVFLVNDGKKDFKIGSLTITTTANGSRSGGPMAPSTRAVDRQQRVLLQEIPGTWQESTTSWSMEVVVTSDHGEAFKSTLTWR